ncbi:MAG TPA: hypothetical protein VJT32_15440 [bacterium]|nr:hypothetical protein [bacterium]
MASWTAATGSTSPASPHPRGAVGSGRADDLDLPTPVHGRAAVAASSRAAGESALGGWTDRDA